jgi:DNA-binding transcriptional LysR family regulator
MNDRFMSMQLFVRVARTGSFSMAGREVGMSQPSVSRIVAALEKRLGARLLRRSTRGAKLTDAGLDYLARTEAILTALDEADHATRDVEELRGNLRIACSLTFAERCILPHLSKFMNAHPKLRISIQVSDFRHDLVTSGVDIAFGIGGSVNANATTRKFGSDNLVAVAAPSYLARVGEPKIPRNLLSHTLIIVSSGHREGRWTFQKSGLTEVLNVEGRYIFDSNEAAISAAIRCLGIVVTRASACQQMLRQGLLVLVLPDWQMEPANIDVVIPDGHSATPSAQAFVDFLTTECGRSSSTK